MRLERKTLVGSLLALVLVLNLVGPLAGLAFASKAPAPAAMPDVAAHSDAVIAANASVSGYVRDTGGNPLAGATVACIAGCNPPSEATTDATGLYPASGDFKLVFGGGACLNVTLSASLADYVTETAQISVCPGQTVAKDWVLAGVAPVVDAGGPYTGNQGVAIQLDATVTGGAGPLTYDWGYTVDSAADGTVCGFSNEGIEDPTVTCTGPGTFTLTLWASDGVTSDTDTATLTLSSAPIVVDAGGPYSGNEGAAISLSASASGIITGTLGLVTYAWSYEVDAADAGTTCAFSSATIKDPTVTCTDDGTFTLTVLVGDGVRSESGTAALTVANVAPVVNAGADDTVNQGATFTGAGSFTDPGEDLWTATVNYGDGDGVEALTLTGKTFTLSHVYTAAGDYTVTVCVTDDEGAEDCDSLTVTVTPLPHRLWLPLVVSQG